MSGQLVLIALGVGLLFWGGDKAISGTKNHVVKPVYNHVLKPVGCTVKKSVTLGKKSCAKGKK